MNLTRVKGVEIIAPLTPEYRAILTPEALDFVALLVRRFSSRREELLNLRRERQAELDKGVLPDFLKETESIRNSDWKITSADSIPQDLLDRKVEITGPAGDAKMVINAFNSGANVYMTDFEDSQSPTWRETIQGQINVRDAIRRTISYVSPEGKRYKLNEKIATLMVRPRGWHLLEKHAKIDGMPISASIFDFALFLFHNASELIERGTGPYFYLPKIENRLEARLWNDVFVTAEDELAINRRTIKATVLIETILAAFEMDEILHELRDYIVGLNCGRWDYIFSFIKKLRTHSEFLLPDRAQVTMDKAFLASYVDLLIKTCHRRGAFAMGGMSAFIPIRNNEEANKIAFDQVRKDKEREVKAGHDGTWVAHPGLVPLARQVFDEWMKEPNQLSNLREDVKASPNDLLKVPSGSITEKGIRTNASVGVQYLAAWLEGKGSVPLYNLMEDAATAEICRSQLWQWIHHNAKLSDGRILSKDLVLSLLQEELNKLRNEFGQARYKEGKYDIAAPIFSRLLTENKFENFLTTVAYEELLELEKRSMSWRTSTENDGASIVRDDSS
jgi:malate synthase